MLGFTTKPELAARVETLEAELSAAQDKLATLEADKAEAQRLNAELTAQLAQVEADYKATKVEFDDLSAEFDAAKADFAAQLEAAKASAEAKAAEIVGTIGHPPIEQSANEVKEDKFARMSRAELEKHALSIRGRKEKAAFVTKYLRPLVGKND